jgi:hypothetical protein
MDRRSTILLFPALALAACAQAPTQRLNASSQSIHAVRVFAWGRDDPALTSPSHAAFVETLNRNGLQADQFVALQRPFEDLKAFQRSWAESSASESATHALVLTRQFEQTGFVRYEAVLWEASSAKLVWKGALASAASFHAIGRRVMPMDAAKRAERLAADVLRGLDRDGLFALNGKVPRDAQGQNIPPTLIPFQLLRLDTP